MEIKVTKKIKLCFRNKCVYIEFPYYDDKVVVSLSPIRWLKATHIYSSKYCEYFPSLKVLKEYDKTYNYLFA